MEESITKNAYSFLIQSHLQVVHNFGQTFPKILSDLQGAAKPTEVCEIMLRHLTLKDICFSIIFDHHLTENVMAIFTVIIFYFLLNLVVYNSV